MLTVRKALALTVVSIAAAAAALVAIPARTIPTGVQPAHSTPVVATTVDNPPKWVLVDDGTRWDGNEPYVTCALGTPVSAPRRQVWIDIVVWRAMSPVAYTRGNVCPTGRDRSSR